MPSGVWGSSWGSTRETQGLVGLCRTRRSELKKLPWGPWDGMMWKSNKKLPPLFLVWKAGNFWSLMCLFLFPTQEMTRYLRNNYLADWPLQGQDAGDWILISWTRDFLKTDLLPHLAWINFYHSIKSNLYWRLETLLTSLSSLSSIFHQHQLCGNFFDIFMNFLLNMRPAPGQK